MNSQVRCWEHSLGNREQALVVAPVAGGRVGVVVDGVGVPPVHVGREVTLRDSRGSSPGAAGLVPRRDRELHVKFLGHWVSHSVEEKDQVLSPARRVTE